MPNWVKNKVSAVHKGDAERLYMMLVCKSGGKMVTNFNGIIGMPDEIRHTSAPNSGPSAKALVEKYGYADWYDFACAKWGTKWDYNHVDLEGDTIVFETAWSIPCGVYKEISKTIPIVVAYADEDIGRNCGVILFNGGEASGIDLPVSLDQLANAVWDREYSGDEEWDDENDYSEIAESLIRRLVNA